MEKTDKHKKSNIERIREEGEKGIFDNDYRARSLELFRRDGYRILFDDGKTGYPTICNSVVILEQYGVYYLPSPYSLHSIAGLSGVLFDYPLTKIGEKDWSNIILYCIKTLLKERL